MKAIMRLFIVPIVLLAGPARAQDSVLPENAVRTRERVTVRGVPGAPVEVVSADFTAGTISLRTDGNAHVYVLGPDAASALRGIGPGDKVMLRWRFNKAGQPEALIRPVPASMVVEKTTTTETISTGPGPVRVLRPATPASSDLLDPSRAATRIVRGPVEVLEIDTAGRTLTVLDDHGDQRVVPIDDRADGLADLRPGSRVDLALGPDGRVVSITFH